MHSNYGGGVSEMQQFMMDGCPSSLFSISTSPPPPPPQNSNSGTSEVQKFHPLQHHLQQPPPPPMPPHFAHFGQPIPITQQLFQQSHHHHVHHHHQLQLFQQQHQQQQQHMGLDQESGPENSNSPARMMGGGGGGGPSFLAAMNFKLGVNESSGGGGGGGSRDGINEDEGILQGDDDGSESRLHLHHQHRHPWHREEESAAAAANIKEPFWRPLDIDFINPNNKRPAKDKQPAAASTAEISSSSSVKHFKKSNDSGAAAATDSNYKLFSELEAIYKPGGSSGVGAGGGGETNNNQTGSGSALTGDDNPLVPLTAPGPTAEHGQPDNISDTSNADGAPQKKTQKENSDSGGAVRRKRGRKRRQQKQLSSIVTFFESLVKQLMDHQESLHRKFLDVMEKKDQERSAREEACRKLEAAKVNREAAARGQERALAATREAAIISFLEKISGESLNLPTKAQFQSQFTEESQQKDNNEDNAVEIYNADSTNNNNNNNSGGGGLMQFSSSRWPKAEVQALIRVRSGFESKFQEPGLKGPLWEEVSLAMAAMGYQRSAKRCKEKWENINKYFRKTKDSGKKRPQHSKTCPYFHQLDQLYSKTPSLSKANHVRKETNSELLDAIVVSNEAKRNEEGNEEEGQGESQDQEENADISGDRSPVRMEQNQEHNSSDHHLLNRLNS